MAWQFDPSIYFQKKPFDPFQSIMSGLAMGQQLKQRQLEMGLAKLASAQAERRLALDEKELGLSEQKFGLEKELMPMRLKKEDLELQSAGLSLDTNRLKLGEAQKAIEKQKKLEDVGERFAKGEIGQNEFNANYMELYPETIPVNLEKQAKAKAEKDKLEMEQKQWNLEYQRKLNNDLSEKSWKEFQKEYQIKKPFIENQIEQDKLESSLWGTLKAKRVEGQTLTPKTVENVTRKTANTSTLFSYIDSIKGLVKKHGTEQMPTEAKAQLQSSMRQLQGLLKSEDFINLGVLTGPDLGFLEDITGDPTGIYNMRSDRIISRLDELDKGTLTKFNNDLMVSGFKPFARNEFVKVPDAPMVGGYKQKSVRPE
jgi:hypothetical protein